MANTRQSKQFLTQLHFKIGLVITILLIISLILVNFTTLGRLEYILTTFSVMLILAVVCYFGYRRDFADYDREISDEINNNMAFKSAMYSAPVAMLITDGEQIVYHNSEVRTLFKKSFRVIETSKLKDLLLQEYAIMFANEIKDNVTKGQMIVLINNKVEQRDESVCIMNWEPVFYNNKDQYFLSFVDITNIYNDRYNAIKLNTIYENVINKLPYSIAVFEENGKLHLKNTEYENSIGYTLNDDFNSLIEFNINKNLLNTGFQIALSGDTYREEKIIAIDGGVSKWGDIILTSTQTDDGSNYVIYIVNDVSEYKEKVNYLEKQNSTFISGYEKNIIAMASWNHDGTIFKANEEFYSMLQLKNEADLNLFSDSFQSVFEFDEIIFLNDHNSNETKKFYGNTLRIGKKMFSDSMRNFTEANLYIRLSETNPIKRKRSQANKIEDVWFKINTYTLYSSGGSIDSFVTNITDVSDKFDLEKRFEVTDTYLKSIANNLDSGIILIVDAKENVIFIGGNKEVAKRISSYKKHIYASNVFPLSDVEDLSELSKNVIATLNGHSSKIDHKVYGEQYNFVFNPVRNSKGEIDYCLIFGINISEREEFEKQLMFQEYLLDKTFKESQIPQVIINANGLVNRANIEYLKLAGITPDNLHDLSIYDKNCWLNNPEIIKHFEITLNGKSTHFEIMEKKQFSILRDDNESYLYVLNCRSYPIIDSNNVVTNVIFNFIDISETRALIEKMRESNTINDVVVENYPSGLLIVLENNYKVLLFSGAEEIEQLKLDESKIIGNKLDNIHGTIFDVLKPHIEKAVEKKESDNFDFDIEITPKDSFPTTIYYEANIIPVLDFYSNVERIFVCLNNITHRKQLEETILEFNSKLEEEVLLRTTQLKETTYDLEVYVAELQDTQKRLIEAQNELKENLNKEQELNQMKSQFISLMSHEFRTPLTIIQTTVYLLESYFEMGLTAKFENGGKRILYQIELMTKLLDNILFLDEMKEQSAIFSNIDIVSYIHDAVYELKDSTMAKHDIIFKTEQEKVIMYSDEKLIKQIVNNLLLNAINYSPHTKPIKITLLDSEEQFIFIIQDFGNGISDDVIDRMYETFVRSRDFTNISGVGLGLAITKNCVNLLKGDIKFDTEKGYGTTFYVSLPKFSKSQINSDTNNYDEELISDTGIISSASSQTNMLEDDDNDDDILISDTGIM
ncbi:MAG: HAMP domain-containing histidine kinase [Bacteroidetes bacterium]|nr:HAMP domain-containing histidine kinase [Bacteroidota bacterium]